ncbi:branched-chain amino acid aminotransferase [Apibacter muscae]|uniref:Branched-chain amino acid aminotransferase n=1 Tax=Apibacter muscae TaxID=2509004 RepID=A0A563DFM4_9FLAO|nr:aminotransferase class IV [Apibacter muscae]TWP29000.1 branched-chain amino acid aminotransferase [Apibacter muscae]TWP30419.1 branched-chain amino acid aminotransferase [Apibacter muscae]
MYRFLETILIKNHSFQNIAYHNQRANNTCQFFFKKKLVQDISEVISIPPELEYKETYRCRIIYTDIIEKVEFIPYLQKPINSIQVVYNDDIEYSFKFENRSALDALKINSSADDILIVKNNYITDTSIANILLRKYGQWYTPKHPLLHGTERQRLLDLNFIIEKDISIDSIDEYDSFCLINALRPFSNNHVLSCKNLIF